MSREEKFYTSEDLTGYDLNDRLYSESEVEQMNDLFSEFYELHSDFYQGKEEEAYADFFDAYSQLEVRTKPNHVSGEKGNPKLGRAIATAGGGAVGYGIGKVISRKDRAKKAILVKRISSGTASKQDIKDLSTLNKRISLKEASSTIAGAGVGLGLSTVASKLNKG